MLSTTLPQQVEQIYSQHFADFPLFACDGAEISSRFFKFELYSRFRPIVSLHDGSLLGHRAALLAQAPDQTQVPAARLFELAGSNSALVTLDRMLRTLHVLNYLRIDPQQCNSLLLPVDTALLGAVRQGHGRFFEQLLGQLGYRPHRVVLTLRTDALHDPQQYRAALASYREHGFGVALHVNGGMPLAHLQSAAPDYLIAATDGNAGKLRDCGIALIGYGPEHTLPLAKHAGFSYFLG